MGGTPKRPVVHEPRPLNRVLCKRYQGQYMPELRPWTTEHRPRTMAQGPGKSFSSWLLKRRGGCLRLPKAVPQTGAWVGFPSNDSIILNMMIAHGRARILSSTRIMADFILAVSLTGPPRHRDKLPNERSGRARHHRRRPIAPIYADAKIEYP